MCVMSTLCSLFFFFNDTATTEIYTLSLHDALPILLVTSLLSWGIERVAYRPLRGSFRLAPLISAIGMSILLMNFVQVRSEEHTSELQSRQYLVCRLLLEKKNTPQFTTHNHKDLILS